VYYAVDEMTGFGGMKEEGRRRIRQDEELLLRRSDLALAVSPRLLERFRRLQPRAYLLPNGVDFNHFRAGRLASLEPDPALAAIPRPRFGYVGYLNDRLDYPMLTQLARRHPDWHLVFVGRVQDLIQDGNDFQAFQRQPNVHLLGQRPYAELPRFTAGFDGCIAPYLYTPLTQSCNPLKVYEYLATGLPTVVSPVEGLAPDVRSAVDLASGLEQWDAALTSALAEPEGRKAERLQVAQQNSWDARVDRLEDFLEEAMSLARLDPARTRGRWWTSGRGARRALRWWGGHPPLDGNPRAIREIRTATGVRAGLQLVNPFLFWATRLAGWIGYLGRLLTRLPDGRRPRRIRRILVSRRGSLGDAVVFLPTLQALRSRFPHAHITVAAGDQSPLVPAIVELSGCVDRTIRLVEGRQPFHQRLRQTWSLLAGGYDLLVMGHSTLIAPAALYCGAPFSIGLFDHPIGRRCRRVLLFDPKLHEADNNLALPEAAGATIGRTERIPRLRLSRTRLEAAWRRVLEQVPALAQRPYIVMHPGSKRPAHRWPVERFGELARRFLGGQDRLDLVITGNAEEAGLAGEIAAALDPSLRPRVHDTCGRTTVEELFALVDRAAAVVSNDTGTMHVARARDRPLLALMGPGNDRRWEPYPHGQAPAIVLRHAVPCAPCEKWTCPGHFCMRQLTVDETFAALEQLLGQSPAAAGQPSNGSQVTAGSRPPDTLGTLDRRRSHWSWPALASAGYTLPTVTVAAILPERTAEAAREAIEALAQATAGCPYPGLTALAVIGVAAAAAIETHARHRGIQLLTSDGSQSAVARITQASGADLIRFWSGEPLTDLPEQVAALYRSPPVMGFCGHRALDLRLLAGRLSSGLGACTIHRKALELLTVQKLSVEAAQRQVPQISEKTSEQVDLFSRAPRQADVRFARQRPG
jgi:ADP-heptose:LPS heptosyltransferase